MISRTLTPLQEVMALLSLSATDLARASGIDHSLISKWVSGNRQVTRRSKQLVNAAASLLELDENHLLDERIAPFCQQGEGKVEALVAYLTGAALPGLPPRVALPKRQTSGEYTVQYRVFLGEKGFHKVALTVFDYLSTLPPNLELIAVCQGRFEWITGDIPFLMQFILRLKKAFARGTRLLVINRRGYSLAETAAFAWPWMVAHLRGYVRSRYFDGEEPSESMRFAASIPGYMSALVEEDDEVEDKLFAAIHTDPRDIREEEAMCRRFQSTSRLSSQYSFLSHPMGVGENVRLWGDGGLPAWDTGEAPDGSFSTICGVPGFGIMTDEEYRSLLGGESAPALPGYLFREKKSFSRGPHRVVLCREDVREALSKKRFMHEPLSALAHRRVFVGRDMLIAQLRRLLEAAERRDDFEIALVPRVAFSKIQMEAVCWKGSVTVGWLQDMSESVFADDRVVSGTLHSSIDHVWDLLLMGWKRKSAVVRQLKRWIEGADLDDRSGDSAVVRNWDILPKE